MKSKAVMDKVDGIKGSGVNNSSPNMLQDFSMPQAKYNIPQEFMKEQTQSPQQPYHNFLLIDKWVFLL